MHIMHVMKSRRRNKTGALSSISPDLLERMADTLKILAHSQRLQIVDLLDSRSSAPVHEIMTALALPQAATSQHLNAMRRAGLLKADRRGKEVWYAIADPRALTILDCIRKKA